MAPPIRPARGPVLPRIALASPPSAVSAP